MLGAAPPPSAWAPEALRGPALPAGAPGPAGAGPDAIAGAWKHVRNVVSADARPSDLYDLLSHSVRETQYSFQPQGVSTPGWQSRAGRWRPQAAAAAITAARAAAACSALARACRRCSLVRRAWRAASAWLKTRRLHARMPWAPLPLPCLSRAAPCPPDSLAHPLNRLAASGPRSCARCRR